MSVNVCCICVFTSAARTVVPSLPQSLLWWEYHLQGGCALVSGWPLQVCRQCHDTVNSGVVASFLVACTQANFCDVQGVADEQHVPVPRAEQAFEKFCASFGGSLSRDVF